MQITATENPGGTQLGEITWCPAVDENVDWRLSSSTVVTTSHTGPDGPAGPGAGPEDAVTRLGDLVRNDPPPRRPLSERERHRRRRRDRLAKLSRRRNRRQ